MNYITDADFRVFTHHIYEYQKGLRSLVLHTMGADSQNDVEYYLHRKHIHYHIQSVTPQKINVFFGDNRCVDIINYLDDTLDPQYPISHDLSRMYEYFTYQLGRIRIGRNKDELEHLRPMLLELRDAFHTAEHSSAVQGKQA